MEMNIVSLIEQFGSEDNCRAYLESVRWPNGLACIRCGNMSLSRIEKRHVFDCNACRYQFSTTAGTIFHDSHLPLWKWFLATYLMCESKKGMSANQLKRTLNVSYKTAWYLCHRIRAALKEINPEPLSGVVEMDETYVGGKRRGTKRGRPGKDSHKVPVIGVVQRGGSVRMSVSRTVDSGSLETFLVSSVSNSLSAIYTDSFSAYKGMKKYAPHETVDHHIGEYARGDVSTNQIEGVWSLFKRSIVGSYHKISEKHLPAYLDEASFRFNNRTNSQLFRLAIEQLLKTENVTFKELTQ